MHIAIIRVPLTPAGACFGRKPASDMLVLYRPPIRLQIVLNLVMRLAVVTSGSVTSTSYYLYPAVSLT
ncbi:hypothetical protein CEXT_177801 [Caerostris extrusa]|uniref:Uncharacterized protein n=1 Tax=Caerostris extrusa TaxID=172846 RepID=A0AAV4TDP1_CAEEX|nr:hypothetical protein CEXT_177801 [Caerostris extrusa]